MQPVSAMAVVFVEGGEGASVGVTSWAILCGVSAKVSGAVGSLGGLAVPHSYSAFLIFGPHTLSLPPFLSLKVASSSWPSALLLQVLLVCAVFLLLPWVQQYEVAVVLLLAVAAFGGTTAAAC